MNGSVADFITAKKAQLLEKKANCPIQPLRWDHHFNLLACRRYEVAGETAGLQELEPAG
jgi:hypothetical protein